MSSGAKRCSGWRFAAKLSVGAVMIAVSVRSAIAETRRAIPANSRPTQDASVIRGRVLANPGEIDAKADALLRSPGRASFMPPSETGRCDEKWAEFFDRPETTLTVAFGNTGPEVDDRASGEPSKYEFFDAAQMRAFRTLATAPCNCWHVDPKTSLREDRSEAAFASCLKLRVDPSMTPQRAREHARNFGANAPQFANGDQLCGFTQDPLDQSVLVRELKSGDPTKVVRLKMISGSTDESDWVTGLLDRTDFRSPDQAAAENRARARSEFLDALCTSRAVFYTGHARYGCGPDFEMSRRDPKTGRINSQFYKNKAASRASDCAVNEMEDRLRSCAARESSISQSSTDAASDRSQKRPTQILGILACDPAEPKHAFGPRLRRVSPHSAQMISNSVTHAQQGFEQVRGAIEAILARRCNSEFHMAARSWPQSRTSSRLSPEGSHESCVYDARLVGFFEEDPAKITDEKWKQLSDEHKAAQCSL